VRESPFYNTGAKVPHRERNVVAGDDRHMTRVEYRITAGPRYAPPRYEAAYAHPAYRAGYEEGRRDQRSQDRKAEVRRQRRLHWHRVGDHRFSHPADDPCPKH
jgi:hypothetical protein